jgi:hypothetical protein
MSKYLKENCCMLSRSIQQHSLARQCSKINTKINRANVKSRKTSTALRNIFAVDAHLLLKNVFHDESTRT